MRPAQGKRDDPRGAHARAELAQTIRERYPTARFSVSRREDEPQNFHLVTTVDVANPDEIVDVALARFVERHDGERIPRYVMPVRTAERSLADQVSRATPP